MAAKIADFEDLTYGENHNILILSKCTLYKDLNSHYRKGRIYSKLRVNLIANVVDYIAQGRTVARLKLNRVYVVGNSVYGSYN